MAYGGAPTYIFNARSTGRFNFLRIEGLTLDDFVAGPLSIANVDTGQLTTAVPVANQTAIPAGFGRGRGNWQPDDANLIADNFRLVIPDNPPAGVFAVPATADFSPQIINGNLILTHRNIMIGGAGPLTIRAVFQFVSTLVA